MGAPHIGEDARRGVSSVQYSGQGRERLIQAVAATSNANGLISFSLGPCPLGFVWQGSIVVTNAPSGALFTTSVGSTPWGQHAGATNFGPVQLWGNETLTVAGVGLQKLTQYSMLFVGVALPEQMADPLPPVAPSSVVEVETSTLLVNGQEFSGAGAVTLTPPSLTRRLTVVVRSGSTSNTIMALLGQTTGATYGSGTFNNVDGPDVFYFSIEPTVDAQYTLSFGGTVACTVWVTANTTSPLVSTEASGELVIAQPVLVTFGQPITVAGGPTGPFNAHFLANPSPANNVALIAAPGVGNSIYVQTLNIGGVAATAGTFVRYHAAGGNSFCTLVLKAVTDSETAQFPGGFELPTNTALQVDVITGTPELTGTYAVGPTL